MAVGAFFRQQSRQTATDEKAQEDSNNTNPEALDLPDEDVSDDNETQGFVLSVKPVTDPDMASGATYSAHAPAGEESPYGLSTEGKKKTQAQANLLRWCGRSGNIQLKKLFFSAYICHPFLKISIHYNHQKEYNIFGKIIQ